MAALGCAFANRRGLVDAPVGEILTGSWGATESSPHTAGIAALYLEQNTGLPLSCGGAHLTASRAYRLGLGPGW